MLDATARVPSRLRTDWFIATPLTVTQAELDYAAYVASPDVIRVHSDGRWPVDGFTLDDDRRLTLIHQADHHARRAFTFLLLDPTETEALGCVYLNPLQGYLQRVGAEATTLADYPPPSAMVTFWVRQDRQETGLSEVLVEAVTDWLIGEWPFRQFLFRALPDEAASCAALEHAGLHQVTLELPQETRPYRWYAAPVADRA